MGQLRKVEKQLRELGYQIVAVSPDRPERVRTVVGDKQDLDYTLLSDSGMEAAGAFGLAFRVAPDYRERLSGFGIDLEEASGREHGLLPVPAVFVVDDEKRIQFTYVNPDYRIRIDPDTLLAAATAASRRQ